MPVKNPTFNGKPLPPRQQHREFRMRGSLTSQPVHGPTAAPGPCAHHWKIETPNGALSAGVCRRCGAEKQFRNSTEDSFIGEQYGQAS